MELQNEEFSFQHNIGLCF